MTTPCEDLTPQAAAFFDFDGTLTHGDTMIPFILSAIGLPRFILALVKASPRLAGRMLHLCSTQQAKEALFGACFKGMPYETFRLKGLAFAHNNRTKCLRDDIARRFRQFAGEKKCAVAIVSASMQEWVEPFFDDISGIIYITTRPGIDDDGRLTGRFATPNCKGAEKVRRILEIIPQAREIGTIAFGNSAGDKEMLSMARKSVWVK